jgi:hypothetical protein
LLVRIPLASEVSAAARFVAEIDRCLVAETAPHAHASALYPLRVIGIKGLRNHVVVNATLA